MKNLRKLREEYAKMDQKPFAKQFDVGNTTYSNYENDITEPKFKFLRDVAIKYEVSMDFLLDLTDDPHGTRFGGKSQLDERYSALDAHGKRLVDAVMDIELGRVEQPAPNSCAIIRTRRLMIFARSRTRYKKSYCISVAPQKPIFRIITGFRVEWHSRGQRFDPAYLHQDALGYDVGKRPDFKRNQVFFLPFCGFFSHFLLAMLWRMPEQINSRKQ